ncbi:MULTISPECIES: hypothetical protein [Qipengyuania]|jgi:hypothetical protein|nr:hypothetical protein [Qipengyuania pacifica]MBY8332663.1 hypothetical protein [Qipengyuania pacifica]|tara:strand:+ start:366 stop:515 length:150 start_codon:yes stop_codon:yes gene_type:complete
MDQKDKKPAQPQQGDKASNDRNPQQEQRDSGSKQQGGGGKSDNKSHQNR